MGNVKSKENQEKSQENCTDEFKEPLLTLRSITKVGFENLWPLTAEFWEILADLRANLGLRPGDIFSCKHATL